MSATTFVHLIGGSRFAEYRLDIKNSTNGFASDLQNKLGTSGTVYNHAVDLFTTSSILNGAEIGKNWPTGSNEQQEKLITYLSAKGFDASDYNTPTGIKTEKCIVHPLMRLKAFIDKAKDATHYVVIDVGVEDIQGCSYSRPWTLLDIRNLSSRINKIVQKTKEIGPNIKPILVIQRNAYYIDAHDAKIAAMAAGALNLLGIMTFAVSATLALAGKISRLKGAFFSIVALATILAVHYVVPFKVALQSYKPNSGTHMINSIWERFYRPILCNINTGNDHILDMTTLNASDALESAIHFIVTNEDIKKLKGCKVIYKNSGETFNYKHLNDPANWSPGSYN
jgi:hypothetical protein